MIARASFSVLAGVISATPERIRPIYFWYISGDPDHPQRAGYAFYLCSSLTPIPYVIVVVKSDDELSRYGWSAWLCITFSFLNNFGIKLFLVDDEALVLSFGD